MVKVVSGGGYNCKVTSSKKASWKTEPKSKAIDTAAGSTMGISTAFKKPSLEMGPGYTTKAMPATGLRGTYNAATQGPSSQRTVYKAGSQSATPEAHGMPAGRSFDERPNKGR